MDVDGKFIDVSIGWFGSIYDVWVLWFSILYRRVENDVILFEFVKYISGVYVWFLLIGDFVYF